MTKAVDYYFSVLSDWAYMGGERLERLAVRYGVAINHMPIRLASIYEQTGGILLEKRSKQRQDYRVVELARWRDYIGIPVELFPKYYPTSDLLSSCLIIAAKRAGQNAGRVANAVLRAIWAEQRDIADTETLIKIADGLGMDGAQLLESAQSQALADELDRNTAEAIERGVFGSPFYFFDGNIYWGQDRLGFLEDALANAKPKVGNRPLIPDSQGVKP